MPETRGSFTIACACGSVHVVGVESFGRRVACQGCHESFKVIWALDPRSKKKVPVRMPLNASPGSKPSEPLKSHPGRLEITCTCGQPLLVARHQIGSRVRCPICNRVMTIEGYKDPETQTTRVRRAKPASKDDKPADPATTPPTNVKKSHGN
jgi:hypothetical protein